MPPTESLPLPSAPEPQPYAPVVIKLLQGVLYSDDLHWDRLQSYLSQIEDYFGQIGLQVRNFETEGFAYLSQSGEASEEESETSTEALPRLTARRRLSFNQTIFCVLLREQLRQSDASDATERLILSIDRIRELLQPYLPESNNESRFRREVVRLVKQAEVLGFLKRLASEEENYEVRPILKAKIDAEMLERLKQKLEEYDGGALTEAS